MLKLKRIYCFLFTQRINITEIKTRIIKSDQNILLRITFWPCKEIEHHRKLLKEFLFIFQELDFRTNWQTGWDRCKFVLEKNVLSDNSIYMEVRCHQKNKEENESKTLKIKQTVADAEHCYVHVVSYWLFIWVQKLNQNCSCLLLRTL